MYGLLTVKFQTNSFQSSAASATRSLGKLVKFNKMVGPLDLNIDIGSQVILIQKLFGRNAHYYQILNLCYKYSF